MCGRTNKITKNLKIAGIKVRFSSLSTMYHILATKTNLERPDFQIKKQTDIKIIHFSQCIHQGCGKS